MSKDDDDKEYKVGRNRPPRHTRWKPGTSGNPGGRPKGRFRLTSIEDMLASPATISINGKSIKTDTRTAVLLRIKHLATGGEKTTVKMLEPYLRAPQLSKEDELRNWYRDAEVLLNYVESRHKPLE